MNLPSGHLLQKGKYKLTHAVGQGGFGITYKGIWFTEAKGPLGTVQTEVPVCVKEYFFKDYCERDAGTFAVKVHSETGKALFHKFKEKLIKEAKILSEVHHPYIVNVLEVFEENDTAYIAMEYIDGFSLKYRMDKEGVLPEETLLRYVSQIGEALHFVHHKNILHLDIKPSNILIDKNDNARLIDFGVSKRYDIDRQETSTTILTLSKGFASIEQYDDEGTQNFSPCPDIYSLGATMYNLLTGKIPTESILRAARPLIPPRELNPRISQLTETVILKAMQIIPSERYQSVAQMLDALDIAARFPAAARPLSGGSAGATVLSDEAVPPQEEEETTLLQTQGLPTPPAHEAEDETEDEETIVNLPPSPSDSTPVPPKRGRRVAIAVSLFALGASAIAFLVHAPHTDPEASTAKVLQTAPSEGEEGIAQSPLSSEAEDALKETANSHHPEAEATGGTTFAGSENEGSQSRESTTQPASLPDSRTGTSSEMPGAPSGPREPETVQPTQGLVVPGEKPEAPTDLQADAVYQAALAAGKSKMAAADYEGAKQEFVRAKEAKLTEEVVRLLIANDEKAEEKRVADRKALYEEKMDFGPYKIVRKKSTGRYGAIDAKANEQIPCRYLSVGKADQGRAFEREDNLFDIYSPEGELISKGATYY